MATYTPTRFLDPTQLPSSEVTATPGLLSAAVPASTTWVVKEVVVCNTLASPVTVSLSLPVPSGSSGGAGNRLLSSLSLGAGETRFIDCSIVMKTGDFVTGVASTAAAVTVQIHGIQIQ